MFKLIQTCGACPEQYDIYLEDNDKRVGYMRLRHSHFYVNHISTYQTVYNSWVNGDGIFENEQERHKYISLGLEAIKNIIEKNTTKIPEIPYFIVQGN